MIGSDKLDISVENLWNCWLKYKKGKRKTIDYLRFEARLEANLLELVDQLSTGKYRHGVYTSFFAQDNKRRLISVASVRDRLVHRLLYEYLVGIYDWGFDYDVWSCRRGKGLLAAVFRCQNLAKKHRNGYVWRADIRKFFESVDKEVLLKIVGERVQDETAMRLTQEVVYSYPTGLSIGNLTSQVFANIYLNEFDRFVRNVLKPAAYMRYGDDFVLFESSCESIEDKKVLATSFLWGKLRLKINPKNNWLGPASRGIKYLGCVIFPDRIELNRRNRRRVFANLNERNLASYHGLLKQFGDKELRDRLDWEIMKYT